jgi:alanine dehydrogenase
MVIGVPRETHYHEHRVGLTPFGAQRLIRQGHTVVVEKGAGTEAHFIDLEYEKTGAQIVYDTEEVYQRADLVCQVSQLTARELELLRPGSVIASFHHLSVAPRDLVASLAKLEATVIGYELIRDADTRPVLYRFSDMAGQLAVQIAAHHLQTEAGGRGVLLGNVPGVPPPTILIVGAGTAGRSAARQGLASGAHVIVLDTDNKKLEVVHRELIGRVVTSMATIRRLEQHTKYADVVIGAVLIPGARAPFLITEEMVREMKPGSVIVDLSIDQGGCVETGRPTTPADPTFVAHDVVHYCVPNMTANIPRTASRALANVVIPYLESLAGRGLETALREDPGLAEGVYMYRGKPVNPGVAETLGTTAETLQQMINEGSAK